MPLIFAKTGSKVIISRIDSGIEFKNRMASLGIVPGTEVEILSQTHSGPFMIKVKETKLAIGRGAALKLHIA
ncbi:MAG TPA: FeoA family protein [Candidatus Cloacimonadota bacterium]|nr:FeoA family protein [Candidatus Cloacimonadota bacterium]HPM03702.1 FeoA family protein [Candidatus Cloacimonadota bacterium]